MHIAKKFPKGPKVKSAAPFELPPMKGFELDLTGFTPDLTPLNIDLAPLWPEAETVAKKKIPRGPQHAPLSGCDRCD